VESKTPIATLYVPSPVTAGDSADGFQVKVNAREPPAVKFCPLKTWYPLATLAELNIWTSTLAFESAPPVSFTVKVTVDDPLAVMTVGLATAVAAKAGGAVPPVSAIVAALPFQ